MKDRQRIYYTDEQKALMWEHLAFNQAVTIQHGVYSANGRALQVRVQAPQLLPDIGCIPVRILPFELLDLHRQQVGC